MKTELQQIKDITIANMTVIVFPVYNYSFWMEGYNNRALNSRKRKSFSTE